METNQKVIEKMENRITREEVVKMVVAEVNSSLDKFNLDQLTSVSELLLSDWCNGKTIKGNDRIRLLGVSAEGIQSLPLDSLACFMGGSTRFGADQNDALVQGISFLLDETPYC